MEVSVLDIKGQETGRKVALNDAVFGIEPNDHVLYLDVKQYLANQRQGTAKSKERSEMSGSTRKLGRQKGGGGTSSTTYPRKNYRIYLLREQYGCTLEVNGVPVPDMTYSFKPGAEGFRQVRTEPVS